MQHGLIQFYQKNNFHPLEGVLIRDNVAGCWIEWTLRHPGDLEYYGPTHIEHVYVPPSDLTAYKPTRITVITKKTPR